MTPASGQAGAPLLQVEAETAVAACPDLELNREAYDLLEDELPPRLFLDRLMEAELHSDAIRFLARAVPKALAVRWARDCVRLDQGESLTDEELECLQIAELWLKDPTEENRRATSDAAEAARYNTASAMVAAAAAWSGGSLGPAEFEDVPPAEHLTAEATAGALTLVATAGDPLEVESRRKSYLKIGIELAEQAPEKPASDLGGKGPKRSRQPDENGWKGDSHSAGGNRGGW